MYGIVRYSKEKTVNIVKTFRNFKDAEKYIVNDEYVYTIIEIPEPEDNNERYEWGFDLTDFNDFNDEEPNNGVKKFQDLLRQFDMTEHSINKGFEWSNKDKSIILITGNNPITGEYICKEMRQNEKGYLSYVGVSCSSFNKLEEFLSEFRRKAMFIKAESNFREFI